jgi:hypothetical protein
MAVVAKAVGVSWEDFVFALFDSIRGDPVRLAAPDALAD